MARALVFAFVVIGAAAAVESASAGRSYGRPEGGRSEHQAYQSQAAAPGPPALDFEFFRTRVQPIFLHKRKGLARCYVCHSQGTAFRLQPLSPGESSWNEEESRKNFDAARRFVNAANPLMTPLLRMPLAADAGGVAFHPGGKHWTSTDDPEWQTIAAWVRGGK